MKRLAIFTAFSITILGLLVAYDFSHFVHHLTGGATGEAIARGWLPELWTQYCYYR